MSNEMRVLFKAWFSLWKDTGDTAEEPYIWASLHLAEPIMENTDIT